MCGRLCNSAETNVRVFFSAYSYVPHFHFTFLTTMWEFFFSAYSYVQPREARQDSSQTTLGRRHKAKNPQLSLSLVVVSVEDAASAEERPQLDRVLGFFPWLQFVARATLQGSHCQKAYGEYDEVQQELLLGVCLLIKHLYIHKLAAYGCYDNCLPGLPFNWSDL